MFAPAQPTWKPPNLIGGKFATQADADAFKHAITAPIGTNRVTPLTPQQAVPGGPTGVEEHGAGTAGVNYDPVAMANQHAAAAWGSANGFYQYPKGSSNWAPGWDDFVHMILPIIAMAAPAVAGVAGAGAAGASAAAETGAFDASTGLYDVASTPSTMGALGAAEYPGAVATAAAPAAAAATPGNSGGNAAFGGGNQSAAAVGGGSGGATSTMQLVKDYGGLALTLGGLLSAGGSAPDIPNAPPGPEAPPASQAARQPDEVTRRANASTGSTDNTLLTGTSGIDPFTLNLGRSKLLGQ